MSLPGLRLAGTFELAALVRALSGWTARLGAGATVEAAPYRQVLEPLLDPAGALLSHTGANVVLLRPDDLLRTGDDLRLDAGPESLRRAEEALRQFEALLPAALERSGASWIVAAPPPSPAPEHAGLEDWAAGRAARVLDAVRALPGVRALDIGGLPGKYGVERVHDAYALAAAHIPFTRAYTRALATEIVRIATRLASPVKKVVVLDCDNTLWRGVCAEDGPDGVEITPPHRALQEFMAGQRALGRLLCLCSRNEWDDVRAVFERHPEMPLTLEHLTAWRVGWEPKPEAIADLAAELDLSLDSVIFVDDDPVECGQVRDLLDGVCVVELPRDEAEIPAVLRHEWCFDHWKTTDDDRLRADRYRAERRRRDARAGSADYAEFLRRCRIVVRLDPLAEADLDRARQLTERTTQWSLRGEALSTHELRRHLAGDGWIVRVEDVFGSYGAVGLLLVEAGAGELHVRQLLMSCRVLNRGVEGEIIGFLAREALRRGLPALSFHARRTARNGPAQRYLAGLLARPDLESAVEAVATIPAADLDRRAAAATPGGAGDGRD